MENPAQKEAATVQCLVQQLVGDDLVCSATV